MNSFLPFVWKTYLLVVLGTAALSFLFRYLWLRRMERGASPSDLLALEEIGKSFCEFFLSMTAWVMAASLVARQFDDRFLQGFGFADFDDYAFLASSMLALVLPFYSLLWALECMLKPLDSILRDEQRIDDQRHLVTFVRRVAVPIIFLIKMAVQVVKGYSRYLAKHPQ